MSSFKLNVPVLVLCVCLLAIAAGLPGCSESATGEAAGGTRVGVINLDQVAQETGRTAAIEQQLRDRNTEATDQIRSQLEALQNQANAELSRLAEHFGPTPTPDQQRQLLTVQQQARATADRLGRELNMRQQGIVADLRREFRDEIRPTLNQVAEERGITLVLTLDDGVMSFDPAIDLTAAVVQRLQQ
jgi:Skp family chaperone for outer membrane proteins